MDLGLLFICGLTFVIHLIGTLAYSVRIAGSRTGCVALSLSLFNILILVSRTSNSFQAALLAKRVESRLATGSGLASTTDFRWLLASATLATLAGARIVGREDQQTGRRLVRCRAALRCPAFLGFAGLRAFLPTGATDRAF